MARKITFSQLPLKTIFYKTFGVIFNRARVITIFYKQPVYKQLAHGWKITKQLSGLKQLSLSNNKNYRLRKVEFFL